MEFKTTMIKYLGIALMSVLSFGINAKTNHTNHVTQVSQITNQAISPDGKIKVSVEGHSLKVSYCKRHMMDIQIGMDKAEFTPSFVATKPIVEDYEMLTGKKSHCTNQGTEYQLGNLQLRLFNDGLAFRYVINGLQNEKVPKEYTSYRIPEGMKRWMMEWTDAYESLYPEMTSHKMKPKRLFQGIELTTDGNVKRWGYPALLEPQKDCYVLISEANIERNQSASCLYNEGEQFKVTPAENDVKIHGNWHTPWRVLMIGKKEKIVESTLITDLSEPSKIKDTSWINPGVVSWIYWAYNHGSNDYAIIQKYVDMAKALQLPYVLIDAEWDQMKNGKTIEDAIRYAHEKGVKPMIWYNSSVGWTNGAPTPLFRLNKPEDREKEFAWCEKLGIAGVKIDFFSGDNQMNMEYCIDLLECAARHHLLVNFHGATIPRGWQRTYPNLMSTEAVYGAEWYNNVPTFTHEAACHNATLPFTRNVIGSMDYTPCAFSNSQHPHITTNAHELALTVLFESGLQHLADKPESYLTQPQEVQSFLSQLPSTWDETKMIKGDIGKNVIIARRKGKTWFVAGINGTDQNCIVKCCLNQKIKLSSIQEVTVFEDNSKEWKISKYKKIPRTFHEWPNGGFVMVIQQG